MGFFWFHSQTNPFYHSDYYLKKRKEEKRILNKYEVSVLRDVVRSAPQNSEVDTHPVELRGIFKRSIEYYIKGIKVKPKTDN